MPRCIGFEIGLEEADVGVAGFGEGGDAIGIFNSNDEAGRRGGVYLVNGFTSKGEVLLVSRSYNAKKRGVLGLNI